MRAITIPAFGAADVLTLAEVAAPEPGPGQVSIDVTRAPVGLADVLMRRGEFGGTPPIIPGLEAAGTVRAVGDMVTGLSAGQPVVTLSRPTAGGYAEVTVADAAITFPLDGFGSAIDPGLAVAAAPNATTALLALEQVAHLDAGETVLVHGATGALAVMMSQVARELGAGRVVGTVRRPSQVEAATRYGYDLVVPSDDFAATLAGHGIDAVDVIIDPVGGQLREQSLPALAPLGRLVCVGNASGADDVLVGGNQLWLSNAAVLGLNIGGLLQQYPDRGRAAAERALSMLAAGSITVEYTTTPLDQAVAAHRQLEAGGLAARIVLTVR